MARTQTIKFVQNEDGTQTYIVGASTVTFQPDMASAACRVRAELHGWKQRIADKAALGKDATDQQKFDAIKAVIDHYEAGGNDWNMTRGAGGARKSEFDWTCEALAEVQGTDVETIVARLTAMAEKHATTPVALAKKLATKPDVATMIATLKSKGAAEGDDVDAELDAFMTGD
jgi:hypothetical protein